ncbi:MAG TPA: multidrug effflux MFS transporter [Trebonia sp.]|jgi:DHA1 family bicyclomycin/chloramphenicol resistance-like MFS transporter|nr:multidrug effflux MFS transporter [Trebonia sp.]
MTPPPSRTRRLAELAVLAALSAFGPLSMDMYLPATPTIATDLHSSQALVQLTLSGCLAGLAVGQLVAGPLSDGYGRRRPLLAGLVAFTVLSVACALAGNIALLIVLRFLQGAAGATGIVVSMAIVRDLYEGTELARVLGSMMLMFGLAPVLAPVIGGQILRFTDWRGVFGALAAIGLLLLIATCILPETLPPGRRVPGRLRQVLADARGLARDRVYAGNTLAVTCGTAAQITYIAAIPFIIEDGYGQSPQLFSVIFMVNAVGLTAMAQLGTRLTREYPVEALVVAALALMVAAGVALVAAALTGHPPLIALLIPLFVFVSAYGMLRPNGAALALSGQGAIAGTASAWLGALPFLLGAVLSPLAGLGGQGGSVPAAIAIGVLCALALAFQRTVARRPANGSGPANGNGPAGTNPDPGEAVRRA